MPEEQTSIPEKDGYDLGWLHIVLALAGVYFLKWAGIALLFARNYFLAGVLALAVAHWLLHRKRLPVWVYEFGLAALGWSCVMGTFTFPFMAGCPSSSTALYSFHACPDFPSGRTCAFKDFSPYDIVIDSGNQWAFLSLALGRHAIVRVPIGGESGPVRYVDIPDHAEAQRMILGPDGLLYAGGKKFKVYVIDPESMEIKYSLPINDTFASDFALDQGTGKIYVAVMDKSVCVIEPDAIYPDCRRMDMWFTTYDIAIDAGHGVGYLTSWLPGRVYKFDLETMEITAEARLGISALAVEVDPERGLVYVARPFKSSVMVLDADTLEPIGSIPAGFGVRDIRLSPDGGYLLAGNYFARNVTLADTQTRKIVWKKFVGGQVRGVNLLARDGGLTIFTASRCGLFVDEVPFN